MLRVLANPPVLEDFLEKEIAALDRLVERAMKKKPHAVALKEKKQEACAGV